MEINMNKLTHTDEEGRARMVDVGHKEVQRRTALASGRISLKGDTLSLIRDNQIRKGEVLSVAEIAGVQAAKQCAHLIPLCHPLQITSVQVNARLVEEEGWRGVEVRAQVKSVGQTGVEMEALTAVSVALLTVYDMCKAVDKEMVIGGVKLLEKTKEQAAG